MSQTLSLYRLQQIDSQIDHLQTRMRAIQDLLDNDEELRELNQAAMAADAHYQTARKVLNQTELDVQNQHIKIEQTQSDLYGAQSHSPKELQDLQNDVFSLKRHLGVLEDLQLDAMMAAETAETELGIANSKLAAKQKERSDQNKGLSQEQAVLKNDLERFLVERDAVARGFPSTELNLYDKLRQERRGIAVAVIGDNACGACGSTLSLAQIQSVRSSGQMTLCPSCGRILYGS